MKGKNFSANNLGQRRAADVYETPFSLTEQLLERDRFMGTVLEPACGNGAIVKVLQDAGLCVFAYDAETDFLRESRRFDNIITNPPYSLSLEFIFRAKTVARRKIAFLLPLAYLHGKDRYDRVYSDQEFPLATVHVFTRYPMLGDPLRPDGKYRTGMMVYAWFVWDRSHSGPPIIAWIDNHRFVLGARERSNNDADRS